MSIAPHSVGMAVNGWIQENNLVYIKLSQGKYRIGEKVFSVPYSGGEQIIDLDQIENLYRIFEETRIVRYENADSKEQMSVEEFIRRKQKLDVKEWDSSIEDNVWPSITDRHAFELHVALWQPIREPITTEQKVQILVQGEEPLVKHPQILPIRKLTGDLTNTLYYYSKANHIRTLVEEFLKKNGYRSLDQEPPSIANPKDMDRTYWLREGLEFSKMFPSKEAGSKYITIEIPGLKKYEKITSRMTGTFAELEAHYNLIEGEIRDILGSYFNRSAALESIEVETIGKVLSGLENLARSIRSIDSMKKTYSEYANACKQVDDLLKIFRKEASK